MGVFIRKAQKDDFNIIFSLLQQLWPDKKLNTLQLEMMFKETLCSEHDFAFCAIQEQQLLGFIAGVVINNYYHGGSICYVSTLVVESTCRGNHIGTDLIKGLLHLP